MNASIALLMGVILGGLLGMGVMALLAINRPEPDSEDTLRLDLIESGRHMVVPTHTKPYWAVIDSESGRLAALPGLTAREAIDNARAKVEEESTKEAANG